MSIDIFVFQSKIVAHKTDVIGKIDPESKCQTNL